VHVLAVLDTMMQIQPRELASSGILVTPVALGLWPISGMTSAGVNDRDSLATIDAAIGAGINFLDTAYCYGANGESERLLGQAIRGRRNGLVIATKCGIRWEHDGSRINDASPERIRIECDESLERMGLDHIDLMYLHSADGRIPVEASAGALLEIQQCGKSRITGVSNLSLVDLQKFHAVCPVSVVQLKYNMVQRQIETDIVPWCREQGISLAVYWPLMKGLLAGKMRRDFTFDPSDKRLTYPVFQSPQWERNQDLLDELEKISNDTGKPVPELVVAWTIQRPGITAALCGAKRSWQIEESARAMSGPLALETVARIDRAIEARDQAEISANSSSNDT